MRFAICNETFEGWEHERVCRFVAGLGYDGLEVAPFTFAPRVEGLSAARRGSLRRDAERAGLKIVGLHWLLARTEGLHLTSADAAVRQRTAAYLVELARCCRDLGGDRMVFGSPAQRRLPGGVDAESAVAYAADTFRRALPGIADCGVRLCLEPLAAAETDFINTCQQAVEILDLLGHPQFVLHLDVKAMVAEGRAVAETIRYYAGRAGHFHANDPNRRGPGFGALDFVPVFRALLEAAYRDWVSVEVFDYSPDPETIARESLSYMRKCLGAAEQGAGARD